MQKVSNAYKDSMKQPFRNRSYINVTIGVINQNAQKTAYVDMKETPLVYFSNASKPFANFPVDILYATSEEGFAKVDGSMLFIPRNINEIVQNNGIISEDCLGSIMIKFGMSDLDIKGLTIDFGEYYPTKFLIETDSVTMEYDNSSAKWITEDVFNGTSFMKITPLKMVNGEARLRIHECSFGVGNVFTNKDVKRYAFKDYVSPISEHLPSQDMSLSVFNYSGKYCADNPDSALNFMEKMQEISVSFGYDVTGNGDIEWVDGNELYLKSWSADDTEAVFIATDRFDYLTGTFYGGLFRKDGISLFDLAEEVFEDAGVPPDEYFIDPYLKNIIVNNPLPPVSHPEALQLIANAGRCVLYGDRSRRIHLQSSFVPDMTASSNGETIFSHVGNVLVDDKKDAYAIAGSGFSKVDGSLFFLPRTNSYVNTGYISEEVSDKDGTFKANPKITINLEAGFVSYGLLIRFRNSAPEKFRVQTFLNGNIVVDYVVDDPDLEYITHDRFDEFDRMEITFEKSHPYSRVTVDNILIGDVTNYTITYDHDLKKTPTGTRQDRIKTIQIQRNVYKESLQGTQELIQEELELTPEENECIAYLPNASYELTAEVVENAGITCKIVDSSNYYVRLRFFGVSNPTKVKYTIHGKEYEVEQLIYTKNHHPYGEVVAWNNPLISSLNHARDLEEWLESHLLGEMEYLLQYRGNPEFDANDLFYLELKNREQTLIRAYQHELSFSGALSGSIKARKVVGV